MSVLPVSSQSCTLRGDERLNIKMKSKRPIKTKTQFKKIRDIAKQIRDIAEAEVRKSGQGKLLMRQSRRERKPTRSGYQTKHSNWCKRKGP